MEPHGLFRTLGRLAPVLLGLALANCSGDSSDNGGETTEDGGDAASAVDAKAHADSNSAADAGGDRDGPTTQSETGSGDVRAPDDAPAVETGVNRTDAADAADASTDQNGEPEGNTDAAAADSDANWQADVAIDTTLDVGSDAFADTAAPDTSADASDAGTGDADAAADTISDAPIETTPDVFDEPEAAPLPVCGNGVAEDSEDGQHGEGCDDGNLLDGDGCSATCALEAVHQHEDEFNGSFQAADLLYTAGFIASHSPAQDVDYFMFTVTAPGSSVRVDVGDGLGHCPIGFNSKITLYDTAQAFLTDDDDGGVAPCSRLSPILDPAARSLAVGTYWIKVEQAAGGPLVPVYVVDVKVVPPGCGDGILQEVAGEQCDDGNTAAGDGCSPTCQVE